MVSSNIAGFLGIGAKHSYCVSCVQEKVALKKLKLDDPEHNFKVAEHEANSHQRINGHSHIVSLKGMAVLSRTQVAIATEFVPGGDLFDLCKLNGLPSEQFNRFALQITSALVHMHNLGYAHCDLKPENVLITNSNGLKCAKLSDFGSARHYQAVVCFRTQGTDGFQSPEEVCKS
jgi:serine/threonine protein kinase